MRRRYLILALVALFLWAFVCVLQTSAQTQTTVTAHVVDPNNINYAGARLVITLNNPGPGSPTYTPCHNPGAGCPVQVPGPITLDQNGNIPGGGVVLYANASILPAGTTYSFQVNQNPGVLVPWGTGPQVFTLASVTIAGAAQDLSAAFLAVPPPALTEIGSASGGGGKPTAADGLYYVTTEGSDANDCRSWSTACLTVQGAENKMAAGTGGNPDPGGTILTGAGNFSGAISFTVATQLVCNGPAFPTTLTIPNGTNAPVIDIPNAPARITQCSIAGNPTGQSGPFPAVQISGDASQVEIDHNVIGEASGAGISVPAGSSNLNIHENIIGGNGPSSAAGAQIAYVEPATQVDSNVRIENNNLDGSTPENSCIQVLASSSAAGPTTQISLLSITNNTCLLGTSASYTTSAISLIADPSLGDFEDFSQANVAGNIVQGDGTAFPTGLEKGLYTAGNLFDTTVTGNQFFELSGNCTDFANGVTTNTTGQPWTITGNVCDETGSLEFAGNGIVNATITGNTMQAPHDPAQAIYVHGTGAAGYSVVQVVDASGNPNASTYSFSMGTVAVGDVVFIQAVNQANAGGPVQTNTITDTLGNTATLISRVSYPSTPFPPDSYTEVWALPIVTGGADTANLTFAATVNSYAGAYYEIAGLNPAGSPDGTPATISGTAPALGALPFGPITTTNATDALLFFFKSEGGAFTDPAGYTLMPTFTNTRGWYDLVSSAGSQSGSLTTTVSSAGYGGIFLAWPLATGGTPSLEQVSVTGNSIESTVTAQQPGISFGPDVNNSSITSNNVYGAGLSGTTNPAIRLTSSSHNLVDGNTLTDYEGTAPGSIGVDITDAGSTGNCVGINEFSSVTTPVSDSGTSTGCPNSGGSGGGGILVFSNTTLGAPVTVPDSTTTTILSVPVTMPAAGCPCRVLASYSTMFQAVDPDENAVTWVTDGTNTFTGAQTNSSSGSAQNYGLANSAYSPITYANSAVITFTLTMRTNSGGHNMTVETTSGTGAQPTYLQLLVIGSGGGSGGGGGGGSGYSAIQVNGGGPLPSEMNLNLISGTGISIVCTDNPGVSTNCTWAESGLAPLASPVFTGIPVAPTAAPGTNTTQLATTAFVAASGASGAPNQNLIYLSPNCGIQANCYPIRATGAVDCGSGWTGGNPAIVLSANASRKFTAADVGTIAFGTTLTCGAWYNTVATHFNTTILSVTDATHATLSANPSTTCTGTSNGGCTFVWGDVDEAVQLNNWFAAVTAAGTCGRSGIAPAGIMFTSLPVINPAATCVAHNWPAVTAINFVIRGAGMGSTIFVPLPAMSLATCNTYSLNPCFFGTQSALGSQATQYADFSIDAFGTRPTGVPAAAAAALAGAAGSIFNNIGVFNWGDGTTLFDAFAIGGIDGTPTFASNVQIENAGATICSFGAWTVTFYPYCAGGGGGLALSLGGGGVIVTHGGFFGHTIAGGTVAVGFASTGGIWQSTNDRVEEGHSGNSVVTVSANNTAYMTDDVVFTNAETNMKALNVAGSLHLKGTQITATDTGDVGLAGAGNYFDEGGNSFTATTFSTFTGTAYGSGSSTGTLLTTAQPALTSGWSTSTVTAVTGSSTRGSFTITLAGTPTLPAVVTLTFPVAFPIAPASCTFQVGGSTLGVAAVNTYISTAPTATAVGVTYTGSTLTAGDTLVTSYNCGS